ncbi:hypothetical protein [Azotobacter chroococcum]|uniref:hypothetical protein n=1 Tax=Azotobacter chroococcum TaxID=353 RepID=UPI0012FDA99B|nr:hypothetical protein [Azotobacter chroococcum]
MKKTMILSIGMLAWAVEADECDCTYFPFQPNPPCFSFCVGKTVRNRIDPFMIKNINPDVAQWLKTISDSYPDRPISLEKIESPADLRNEALKIQREEIEEGERAP